MTSQASFYDSTSRACVTLQRNAALFAADARKLADSGSAQDLVDAAFEQMRAAHFADEARMRLDRINGHS